MGTTLGANNGLVNNVAYVAGKQLSNPIATPSVIVLQGTIAGGKTNLFLDDACGIASSIGLVDANTGTAMTMAGQVTVDNLQAFLKSFAIIISRFNLNSTVEGDLANSLQYMYPNIDETVSDIGKIFSSLSVSNMQFNPDLLNIAQGFVWTKTALLN